MAAPGLLGSLPFLLFLPLTLKRGVVAGGDALLYNYPLLKAVVEQWRQGSVPLWNPYAFGGTPLLAFHQAGAVYPLNALCLVSPLWWSMQLSLLLHYSLCGIFAYLLFRRLGLSRGSALAGGLVFELCGFGQEHIAMATNLRALPWLPLFLYAVEGLAQRDRWRDVAVGAVAIGLAVTAGHPQATVYALITAGAYGAWLLMRIERERRWRFARSLTLLFTLGLGLSAVQLLPELAAVSSDASRPQVGFDSLETGSEHLAGWLRCLFPQVFWPTDWTLFGSYNGVAACAFLGAFLLSYYIRVPSRPAKTSRDVVAHASGASAPDAANILLKASALQAPSERHLSSSLGCGPEAALGARRGFGFDGRVAFFLGLWVVANVLALGRHLPLAHGLSQVPFLGTFKVPARFGHEAALAAAAIVAFGLQRALCDALFRRALLVSASLLLALVGLTALALGPAFRSQATAFDYFATLPVRSLDDPVLVRGYLAAAGTWVAIAVLRWRPLAWVASALIVASVGLDLAQYALVTGASQITSPNALAAPPAMLRGLRDLEPGQRIMNLVWGDPSSSDEAKALLRRNIPALYGIESVNGNDSLVLWRTFQASGGRLKNWGDVDPKRLNDPGLRVFRNLLGVRYLMLRPGSAPEIEPPLVTLGKTKSIHLLLNPEALPRLFAVDEALPSTTDEAMDAVSTGLRDGKPWDPGHVAWIEGARPEDLPAALTEHDRPLVGSLELGPGRARGEVSGPAPCVLVHASSFARGWRATIDGSAAPILCADGFLQALVVPAGRHTVEFRYAPSSFVLGLALSAVAALLLVAGGWYSRV